MCSYVNEIRIKTVTLLDLFTNGLPLDRLVPLPLFSSRVSVGCTVDGAKANKLKLYFWSNFRSYRNEYGSSPNREVSMAF